MQSQDEEKKVRKKFCRIFSIKSGDGESIKVQREMIQIPNIALLHSRQFSFVCFNFSYSLQTLAVECCSTYEWMQSINESHAKCIYSWEIKMISTLASRRIHYCSFDNSNCVCKCISSYTRDCCSDFFDVSQSPYLTSSLRLCIFQLHHRRLALQCQELDTVTKRRTVGLETRHDSKWTEKWK